MTYVVCPLGRHSLRQAEVTCLVHGTCRAGGGYSHTLPIRVCAAQRGRNFEAPDLERGIHFERAKAPVL